MGKVSSFLASGSKCSTRSGFVGGAETPNRFKMDSEAAGTVAASPGGSTQDVPHQAKLPLSMLTPKNGKLGAWEVCIAWPLLHKGKWKDPQGVEKTAIRFECVLVSLHDPTQY